MTPSNEAVATADWDADDLSAPTDPTSGCKQASTSTGYVATLVHADRETAHTIAAVLQDLTDPPPDALTLFEAGDQWRIDAYYQEQPDGAALAWQIEELWPAGSNHGRIPDFIVSSVPDTNWVAVSQAALPPVAAGRFVVHGSHDRSNVPQGPNAILIDAGEAFGTAHHQTTAGCLMAIDRLTREARWRPARYRRVLDLGCGSGVLAIAVARALPGARILASDMDRTSVEVARANARANGVGGRIRCIEADGLSHPALLSSAPYDLLIANILAKPLIGLASDLSAVVAPGGTLLLSGLLTPQARQIVQVYCSQGFALVRHDRVSGWSTLTMMRSSGRS